MQADLRVIDAERAAVQDEWDALGRRRERIDADCAAALVQAGDIGYAVTPAEIPGVTEIDTGYTDGMWGPMVALHAPAIGIPATLGTALDQHNRLLSADPEQNGFVMEALRDVLGRVSGS